MRRGAVDGQKRRRENSPKPASSDPLRARFDTSCINIYAAVCAAKHKDFPIQSFQSNRVRPSEAPSPPSTLRQPLRRVRASKHLVICDALAFGGIIPPIDRPRVRDCAARTTRDVRRDGVIRPFHDDAARTERGKPRVWAHDDERDDASRGKHRRHERGFHARAATESRARATQCAGASVVRDGARTGGCE